MINTVTLFGRLTADAQMRASEKGFSIAKFSLAVNERKKDQQEVTHFVDCTAFGKTADIVRDYLGKGSPVTIQGKLNQESWETKEGAKKSKLGVIVQALQIVPSQKSTLEEEKGGKKNGKSPIQDKTNGKRRDDFDEAMPF